MEISCQRVGKALAALVKNEAGYGKHLLILEPDRDEWKGRFRTTVRDYEPQRLFWELQHKFFNFIRQKHKLQSV